LKYTTEHAMAEILRRSSQIRLRRGRRVCRVLSGAAGILMCLLILVIGLFPGGGDGSTGSVYGAFLLSREAGGYVLAGVVAFALGVVVTLLCLKQRKHETHEEDKEDRP